MSNEYGKQYYISYCIQEPMCVPQFGNLVMRADLSSLDGIEDVNKFICITEGIDLDEPEMEDVCVIILWTKIIGD